MNPRYDFTGQVALVTGASSGMGLATARAFAEAGAAVVLADINQAALTTATDSLAAAGRQVLGVPCDVAQRSRRRGQRPGGPGTIATPMVTDMIAKGELDTAEAVANTNQPINRLGEPDEIAAAVLWLCSPGFSFVVGVARPVDGGYTAR